MFTEAMPSNHAAVVKRRVDTLNATLRKKQKYATKIDVRNIFPEQRHSGTVVIHSQPVDVDEETGTRQVNKTIFADFRFRGCQIVIQLF